MPNNPTIKGDNTVIWGASGLYTTANGIITGGNKKAESEQLAVKDENGFTVAVIFFDQKNKFSFEMIVKTSAPALAVGDPITVAGVVNALVDDTEEIWAQADTRKFRVNATKYSGMTLT
jgi:hypothetical protein